MIPDVWAINANSGHLERDARITLTGYVTGEPLHQPYSHADLFVLPSYHEGLPIALLEAIIRKRGQIYFPSENKISPLFTGSFWTTELWRDK